MRSAPSWSPWSRPAWLRRRWQASAANGRARLRKTARLEVIVQAEPRDGGAHARIDFANDRKGQSGADVSGVEVKRLQLGAPPFRYHPFDPGAGGQCSVRIGAAHGDASGACKRLIRSVGEAGRGIGHHAPACESVSDAPSERSEIRDPVTDRQVSD